MNFVLSSSLIVSVLAFSVSLAPFQEDQQTQPPNELAQQNDAPKTFRTQNEPLPFSVQIEKDPDKREIKQQILEGWPTMSRHELMSRAAPRLKYHANIVFEDANSESDYYCLGRFDLVRDGKRNSYALQFDRKSRSAKIFVNYAWQDYTTWKRKQLASMKKIGA